MTHDREALQNRPQAWGWVQPRAKLIGIISAYAVNAIGRVFATREDHRTSSWAIVKVASSDSHAAQHAERLRRRGKTPASFCKAPEGRPIFFTLPPDGFKFFHHVFCCYLGCLHRVRGQSWRGDAPGGFIFPLFFEVAGGGGCDARPCVCVEVFCL